MILRQRRVRANAKALLLLVLAVLPACRAYSDESPGEPRRIDSTTWVLVHDPSEAGVEGGVVVAPPTPPTIRTTLVAVPWDAATLNPSTTGATHAY